MERKTIDIIKKGLDTESETIDTESETIDTERETIDTESETIDAERETIDTERKGLDDIKRSNGKQKKARCNETGKIGRYEMELSLGKASIRLREPVDIIASASVVGTKEGQGPLGALFDIVGKEDHFGAKTWEEAESNLQKEALMEAMRKADVQAEELRFLFAGDLLGQSIASSFGLSEFGIPLFGLYGACSTCGEALTLGALTIAGGFADMVACVTSSHFASAEREFRFPLEYGNQRPLSASWTVTGSGAFILRRAAEADAEGMRLQGRDIISNSEEGPKDSQKKAPGNHLEGDLEEGPEKSNKKTPGKDLEGVLEEGLMEGLEKDSEKGLGKEAGYGRKKQVRARICGMTVGKIVDYGLKDSMNMGACMAPAAVSTLLQHFEDWNRGPESYDQIVTGDLGSIGRQALLDILMKKGIDLSEKHLDCGMLIYDAKEQDVHAGGSGCGCCAATLSAYLLKQLEEGFWKRILFLPTGALLSKTSYNEGKTVPGICHAIVLEGVGK